MSVERKGSADSNAHKLRLFQRQRSIDMKNLCFLRILREVIKR